MRLKEKVIIVTGGTKGIGRAVALGAAKEGAKVVIGGRNQDEGAAFVKEVKALYGGESMFVKGDLTQEKCCEDLILKTVEKYGRIDGLVNYAGTVLSMAPITSTTEEQFDDIMSINFKSAFFVTKYAIAQMQKNEGGSIVNMGSMHAYGGEIDRAAYACSKGAMYTLYKHVAKNYSRELIRSNWITIGWVATPGELELREKQGVGKEWLDQVGGNYFPMGRLQTEEDYVDSTVYLLGDGSSQVTGTELFVTGGFMF